MLALLADEVLHDALRRALVPPHDAVVAQAEERAAAVVELRGLGVGRDVLHGHVIAVRRRRPAASAVRVLGALPLPHDAPRVEVGLHKEHTLVAFRRIENAATIGARNCKLTH